MNNSSSIEMRGSGSAFHQRQSSLSSLRLDQDRNAGAGSKNAPGVSNSDMDDGDMDDNDSEALLPSPGAQVKWIILPHSQFRKWWLNIQLFIALYIIWVIPIRVGYDMGAAGFWFWMEGIINLFFISDVVLNFFVAYEHKLSGVLVTDHKLIAMRYLQGWFIIDLLAVFPSDYIVKSIQGTWECSFVGSCAHVVPNHTGVALILILRGMRIFRVVWIFKNFNILSIYTVIGKLQDELYAARWVISIIELLLVLLFLGHLTSCFFYMFSGSTWQTDEEQSLMAAGDMTNWVTDKLGGFYSVSPLLPYHNTTDTVATQNIGQDPVTGQWFTCSVFYHIEACPQCGVPAVACMSDFTFYYRYVTSLYWAYTTMTTVGYGDIVGVTIAEKVWCIITMVIGGFFLSFCFGRMASVVTRLDAERVTRGERMDEVTHFIKDVELPRVLSRKVMDVYKRVQHKAYDKQAVLARLPFDLRTQVLRYLYMDTLKNVPLLHSGIVADDVFFGDLCIRLKPQYAATGTFIYQRGEKGADLYILLRGDVRVLDADRVTMLHRVAPGTLFGEGAFLAKQEHPMVVAKRVDNAVCFDDSDVLRIASEDLAELCETYPNFLAGLKKLHASHTLKTARRTASSPTAAYPGPPVDMSGRPPTASAPSSITGPSLAAALQHKKVDPGLSRLMLDFTQRSEALQRQFLQQAMELLSQQGQDDGGGAGNYAGQFERISEGGMHGTSVIDL